MSKTRMSLLCAVLSAGCATTASAPREAEPSPPLAEALAPPARPTATRGLTPREALAREVTTPLSPSPVDSTEAFFRGQVLAAGPLGVDKRPNGAILLTVPIGTAEPIACFFYTTPIDAGVAARTLFGLILEQAKVERVRATEVKAFAGSPALYLEGDYTYEGKVGRLKMMVHADPVLPKACIHDELGYGRTFQSVTESVATGLTSAAPQQPVAPYYSDVQVMRMGPQVFGFQYTALFRATTGGSVFEASTTLVRPGTLEDAQFQDTNVQEQADAQGLLVSKSYNKRINGTVPANVRLGREPDGRYGIEGQMDGKDVRAQLSGELVGEVGLAQRLRDGLLKDGKAVEAAMWVPPANLAAPTKTVLRPRTDAGPRAATMEAGSRSFNVVLDAHGLVERLEVPAGATPVVQERLSQTGTP